MGPAQRGEAGVEVLDDARELLVALTKLGEHVGARSALELRGPRVEHLLEDERALVDQVGLDVVGRVERQQPLRVELLADPFDLAEIGDRDTTDDEGDRQQNADAGEQFDGHGRSNREQLHVVVCIRTFVDRT